MVKSTSKLDRNVFQWGYQASDIEDSKTRNEKLYLQASESLGTFRKTKINDKYFYSNLMIQIVFTQIQ